jgi:hypothetical protein
MLAVLATLYVMGHFWTPICNVLGYRIHHSICYTCLFTTPLVVIIISVYSVLWSSDVVSRSGPLISSLFCLLSAPECWQLTNSWLQSRAVAFCRQPASTVTPGIEPRRDPWPYICSMSRLLLFFSFFRCSAFDKKGRVGLFFIIGVPFLQLFYPRSFLAESESYVTTDGQSASLSWNKAPIWDLRPDFYNRRKVAGLLMWGALSDERTGLSFTTAAGPSQPSHSRVRAPWDSRSYFIVPDLRLPFSSPPTTRRVTVEVFDPASTRVSTPGWVLCYDRQSVGQSVLE